MSNRQIVITGLGAISPLGIGADEMWHGLLEGKCGIEKIKAFDPDADFSNYKTWNLTVQWTPSDYTSPTNITISWNYSYLNNSEYNNIFLKNNLSGEIINMLYILSYSAIKGSIATTKLLLDNFLVVPPR